MAEAELESRLTTLEDYARDARKLGKTGKREEAIALLDQADILFGVNSKLLCTRGTVFRACGLYSEAHECFDRVLMMDPTCQSALNAKTFAYVCQAKDCLLIGDFTGASAFFDQALVLKPNDDITFRERSYALLAKGKNVKAQKAVLEEMAYDLLREGKIDEAQKCCDDILSVDRKNKPAMIVKGQTYLKEGNFLEANRWFGMVIKLDPQNKAALLFSAKALLRHGKMADAKTVLMARLQLPPVDYESLMLLPLCISKHDPLWEALSVTLDSRLLKKAKSVYDRKGEEEARSLLIGSNLWDTIATRRPVNNLARRGAVGYSADV